MTYEIKKKADRFGEKQPAHAVYGDRIDVTSLYTIDDDLSSILSSPLTGTAIDGTITLCGMSISDMPIMVRKAITKLWFYEHNEI